MSKKLSKSIASSLKKSHFADPAMTGDKRKNNEEERNPKKPRKEDEESEAVSTRLTLFDESWPIAKKPVVIPQEPSFEELERKRISSNIERMRLFKEEKNKKGVNTDLKLYEDPWKIKKTLKRSDLDHHWSRLLLAKDMVNGYIVKENSENLSKEELFNGVQCIVFDLDTGTQHKLVFKSWPSNGSYILNDGWCRDFVFRRELKEGEEIGLIWDDFDPQNPRFLFRVLSRLEPAGN